MKKQENLEWFLIEKFIKILIFVGIVEYVFLFLCNQYVFPHMAVYFFPDYKKNVAMTGYGIFLFLFAVLLLLVFGAFSAIFPSPLREVMLSALEEIQQRASGVVLPLQSGTLISSMSRTKALLLFLVTFVLFFLLLVPYVCGAIYFAKITLTEFKEIQRQREEAKREFDCKRNLMLSDIAHDLRTPMTTISGYAKALSDDMVKDPQKKAEYLQAIQNKSERMNDLIQLLFEYVKLDSEGFTLNRRRVELCELLRENAAMLYTDIEEAGMTFTIDIPERQIYIDADEVQLSRVVTNLINNAIKHNGAGTDIALQLYQKEGNTYVVVADSGAPISEQFSGHLFDPFTREDTSRKSSGGSGLGLSIAKKIIEMHGWELLFLQQPYQTAEIPFWQYTKAFVIKMEDEVRYYMQSDVRQ